MYVTQTMEVKDAEKPNLPAAFQHSFCSCVQGTAQGMEDTCFPQLVFPSFFLHYPEISLLGS